MQYVINYLILEAGTPISLRTEVMQGIKDGWQPLGGVVTATEDDSTRFYQAMGLMADEPLGELGEY